MYAKTQCNRLVPANRYMISISITLEIRSHETHITGPQHMSHFRRSTCWTLMAPCTNCPPLPEECTTTKIKCSAQIRGGNILWQSKCVHRPSKRAIIGCRSAFVQVVAESASRHLQGHTFYCCHRRLWAAFRLLQTGAPRRALCCVWYRRYSCGCPTV